MTLPMPFTAAVLAAVVAAPLALWQAGGQADASRVGARGFTAVSLTTCGDWQRARQRARLQVVADMGDHFGHASHIWAGARLRTADAVGVFERTCGDRRFRSVRLYKVYARALAFSGVGRP
jgi:hypothetical protein